MILKEGGKFYRIQSLTRQQWKKTTTNDRITTNETAMEEATTSTSRRVFLLYTLFLVFLALFFDMSRMGGAVYETAGRLTGYIKGPCISYDTTTQKLYTTPHNSGCVNYADRFIETSAAVIILSIFVAAMHFLGIWIRERPAQSEQPESTRQERHELIKRGTTIFTGNRC